ncbi:MAG: clostripain-related cysteine peptidase [Bacteroidota bacterium]
MCIIQALYPLLSAFLLSCSTEPILQHAAQQGRGEEIPLKSSIIFFIHGDGDYLYHDVSGQPIDADERAVSNARVAAQVSLHAEVFIFHEKRKKHTLWFFPQRDGEFFYYRAGRLEVQGQYWRFDDGSSFGIETELFRRYRSAGEPDHKRVVFFFGHEIPEFDGRGYNASHENTPFTVDTLAACLREFQGGTRPFDLVVLSTCYGGTPHTILTLSPYTRYVIASPDNLHLSYFSIPSFVEASTDSSGDAIESITERFARAAFDTLATTVYTAVSVATYDVGVVQSYVQSVDSVYNRSLSALKAYPVALGEHCDCGLIPELVRPEMSRGVKVFYRPPRFGQSKQTSSHSGWECWKTTSTP